MKRSCIIILLCISFSCRTGTVPPSYDNDVQGVIVANIKETIGTGDSAKMAYRFPPVSAIDDPGYIKYYDSIRSLLDTGNSFINLIDSFAQTQSVQKADIMAVQKNYHGDTAFHNLLNSILYDSLSKNAFDIKGISDSIGLPIRIGKLKKRDDLFSIAVFSFSKIAFNQTRTKAAVYMEFQCGGKCGYGEMRMLEKKFGKWVVTERESTWVA